MLVPSLFNICMDWVLGRVVDQSHCGASVGNIENIDIVFANNAVTFAEWLEVLVVALDAKFPGPGGGLLDETEQSVYACDKNIEILENHVSW